MKMIKSNKGITVIALILTIIVLLILAVVVLIAAEDAGLINKTKDAKEIYEHSLEEEKNILQAYRDEVATSTEKTPEENEGEGSDKENEGEIITAFLLAFIVGGIAFGEAIKTDKVVFPEENPTKEGETFSGWFYDEACTDKANEGDIITADTNLYAGWAGKIVNKLNGGTLEREQDTEEVGGEWIPIREISLYEYETTKKVESFSYTSEVTSASPSSAVPSWKYELKWLQDNKLIIDVSDNFPFDGIDLKVKVTVTFEDGSTDEDEIRLDLRYPWCLAAGTKIMLKDGTEKNIEDITYEDELKVWDFDKGEFTSSKPVWIMKKGHTNKYNLLKFENGIELKTILQHRIFNKEAGKFTYPMTDETPIGTTTFLSNRQETKLISKEVVNDDVDYYDLITDYHMNFFANGILTSCRLSNLYLIKDMKYVKDDRELVGREEYANIPDKYYYGLRLSEQPKEVNRGNDVKLDNTIEEYVLRLENRKI